MHLENPKMPLKILRTLKSEIKHQNIDFPDQRVEIIVKKKKV